MSAIQTYLSNIHEILQKVEETQGSVMETAAQAMAQATLTGHNIFAFGCSQRIAHLFGERTLDAQHRAADEVLGIGRRLRRIVEVPGEHDVAQVLDDCDDRVAVRHVAVGPREKDLVGLIVFRDDGIDDIVQVSALHGSSFQKVPRDYRRFAQNRTSREDQRCERPRSWSRALM